MELGRCVRPIGSYRTFAGSTVKVAACVYNEQRMTFSKCSAWSNCRIVSHQRSSCGFWSGSQRCVKAGEMLDTYEQARRKKGGPVKHAEAGCQTLRPCRRVRKSTPVRSW